MEVPQGKHAWMVKIGEKGQFVIPKEARDIFGFHPGDELLVLGDDERGIISDVSYSGFTPQQAVEAHDAKLNAALDAFFDQ